MAMASVQAGLAFSNAILGAVHAMSHAIGGRFQLPHGEVNAILLPYVMEFNYIATPKKFMQMAELFGESIDGMSPGRAGRKAIDYVKELSLEIGAPQRLSEMGLTEEDAAIIGQVAVEDACMITNPRDITVADVERLIKLAL